MSKSTQQENLAGAGTLIVYQGPQQSEERCARIDTIFVLIIGLHQNTQCTKNMDIKQIIAALVLLLMGIASFHHIARNLMFAGYPSLYQSFGTHRKNRPQSHKKNLRKQEDPYFKLSQKTVHWSHYWLAMAILSILSCLMNFISGIMIWLERGKKFILLNIVLVLWLQFSSMWLLHKSAGELFSLVATLVYIAAMIFVLQVTLALKKEQGSNPHAYSETHTSEES